MAVGYPQNPGARTFFSWDGSRWSRVSIYGEMYSAADIASAGDSDIWLAGAAHSNRCCAVALHWNGTRWQVWTPAYYPNGNDDFNSIVEFAPNDVWAVGDDYEPGCERCGWRDEDFIEHFDGHRWVYDQSLNGSYFDGLSAVRGISSRDMWAVGGGSTKWRGAPIPMAFHRRYGWAPYVVPSTDRLGVLLGIGIVASQDVWTVGRQFGSYADPGRPLIAHWDGHAWSQSQVPAALNGEQLNAVAAVATNDVWAVGGGANGALVLHWDGSSWSRVPARFAQGFLGASVIPGTNDVWAAGAASDPTFGSVSLTAIFHC